MPYRATPSTLKSLVDLGYYNQAMRSIKENSYSTQYFIAVIQGIKRLPSNPSSIMVEVFLKELCAQLINLQWVYRDEKLTLLSPLLVELINIKLLATDALIRVTSDAEQSDLNSLIRTVYKWFKLIRLDEPSNPKLKIYRIKQYENFMYNFEATLRESDTIRDTVDLAEMNSGPGLPRKCYFCLGPHKLYNCTIFLLMNVGKRIEKVLKMCICTNCLKRHDTAYDCTQDKQCDVCEMGHSTRLHVEIGHWNGLQLMKTDHDRKLRAELLFKKFEEPEVSPSDRGEPSVREEPEEVFYMEL